MTGSRDTALRTSAPPASALPRPAAVRYNDWRRVGLPAAGTFAPALPVSVVVPCFAAPEALALTLAGLERQRWPRDLFEVVVVDDGSEPPLTLPATPLDVRVVRQQRRGFGLARARNAGARAAAHDVLVFLDGDVIPEAGLLAAHARWHHAVSDALTLGFCACVSVAGVDAAAVRGRPGSLRELFAGRPCDPPWLERHMARTGDLLSRHEDLFRAVTGHNFGISRAFYDEVGGFDESFARYGGEDTEFAWRAWVRGALLAPVRDAFAWHQGRWAADRGRKDRDARLQAGKLAHRIADPGFRPAAPALAFSVPRHVVTLEAPDQSPERVVEAAGALLADPDGDLVVRIEMPAGRDPDAVAWLREQWGPDPRVRVAPARAALDEFPASPFHVIVPAGADFGPRLVRRLREALGDAVAASARLGDGAAVSITRAWALHRARRAGGTAADYGDVRALPPRVLRKGRAAGGFRRRARRAAKLSSRGAAHWPVAARVWAEARHVRGLRTGYRFLAWLAAGLRWRLRVGSGRTGAPAPAVAKAHADPPLGAEIATLGPRARAVLAASSRAIRRLDGRHVDVVLADTPAAAAGARAPVVLLGEAPALATPAFDPAVHNPIGWVRDVEPRVAALGPRRLLPPGVVAHREVTAEDRGALLHCHHVEDVRAFHAGPAARAGTLARLAAAGVPVRLADRDPELEIPLGAELHALLTADVRGAGAAAREALSIRMRRAALRGHSLRARVRQICDAVLADPPVAPRVSVLLATRRPGLLSRAIANVAAQRYPRLELVLALHGPGFAPRAVEAAVARLAHPVKLLRLGEDLALGSVLHAAAAEARGPLLAKMDDDDAYGPEHLWDLVLAHEYSGAALVGKFPATVYLARSDRTVRCRRVRAETWSDSITGGALLISRADLDRAGGWRRARRHVDRALIDDVLRAGGGVYRTHDAGYLLVRHGDRHTWEADEREFLAGAETVQAGWRPALAGMAGQPPPPVPDGKQGAR